MNTQVKSGNIAFLGGFPGNPLSLGWQKCEQAALNPSIKVVANEPTNWDPSKVQGMVAGILAKYPDLKGISYEDALFMSQGGYAAYKSASIPYKGVFTYRTDESAMGCLADQLNNPALKVFYYTAGNSQDPNRTDRRHDEAHRGKDPAHDRPPDRAAEPGQARHVHEGVSTHGIPDLAHPAQPAPPDVPIGGVAERLNPAMSNPRPVTSDVLSVRRLSKTFGAVQALRDVSIDCHAGEIHALVGENGSGKSTLLGIASGFLAPDEGTVEIGGARLTHHSPAAARRLGLGMAYQDYSHVLDLSVAENLYLAVPADARP